jgi:hypothetical protein
VAGLIVLNAEPLLPSSNSPLINRPYDGLMFTTERDSGAGAYSNFAMGCVAFTQSIVT